MEREIIKLATSQGLWAVLFVALLFYVLKENAKREERLLSCLGKLDEVASDTEEVRDDVKEIRQDVKELKGMIRA